MNIKFLKASNLQKENKVQFDADGDSHDTILKAKDLSPSDIFIPIQEIYDFPDGEIYMCISNQQSSLNMCISNQQSSLNNKDEILAYGLRHHSVITVNFETTVIKFSSELELIPSIASSVLLDKLENSIRELNSLR